MNRLTGHLTAAAAGILMLAGPAFGQVRDYRDIQTPPLRSFTVPQPKRVVLPNGMVLLLMEDRELPIIRGTARIRGGARNVPPEKAGLAGIMAQSWRTGGTPTRTGDQLDELLDSRAAIVETGASDDSLSVGFNVLRNDFDTVFPIFLDLLRNPAFRQEKIDLAKTQANTAIARRNDEPAAIASREAQKLGYGADSPYARQAEYATIASISREDLLELHQRFVHPNNIVFGIAGDFDTPAMERKLRQAFSSWRRGPAAPPPPAPGTPAPPGVYYVAKDDVNQSNAIMVHGGVLRSNPDYPALQVLNEVLNSERLFPRIRTQQGLAYSVGGGVGSGWDAPALFRVSVGTKSETTLQAIHSLRRELDALHGEPFLAEEIGRAKDSILNAHVFTIDTRLKILNQAMNIEFYGYPRDWYQRYPDRVRQVTAEDVARVAKQYVQPQRAALLVLGRQEDFDQPLSTLGPVTPIDITIPVPGAAAASPAASNPQGQVLFERVRAFAGGKASLDALQAVRSVQSMSRRTPQGPMDIEVEQLVVFPDRIRSQMKMPMGEMTMVLTPEASFMAMGGMGVREIPSSQRETMRAESKQDLLTILKYPERYTFAAAGTEKIGDVDAQVLEVSIDGDTARWLVDPASGRVLRKVSQARGPMAQGEQVTEYTEWKSFGGVMFPVASRILVGGEQAGSTEAKTIEVNPPVEAAAFEKPAA
ncbi:MAG TPA: pitrilysin family protein [Thermoanaerobaculia bacterium]|nr:pitrilysin family protein [Thermoanaerobaculia bacterium]